MITVTIGPDQIRRGLRGSQHTDAFAKAVSEAIINQLNRLRNSFRLSAPNRDVLFVDGYMIPIPEIAQNFIRKSDHHETLVPIQFELDISSELFEPRQHQKYE
jgi:hypothetical protein